MSASVKLVKPARSGLLLRPRQANGRWSGARNGLRSCGGYGTRSLTLQAPKQSDTHSACEALIGLCVCCCLAHLRSDASSLPLVFCARGSCGGPRCRGRRRHRRVVGGSARVCERRDRPLVRAPRRRGLGSAGSPFKSLAVHRARIRCFGSDVYRAWSVDFGCRLSSATLISVWTVASSRRASGPWRRRLGANISEPSARRRPRALRETLQRPKPAAQLLRPSSTSRRGRRR